MKKIYLFLFFGAFCMGTYAQTYWSTTGNEALSDDFLGTTNDMPLIFKINETERMQLSSDGFLGIGTADPKEKLHIAGNILSEGDLTVKDKITLTEDYTDSTYWEIKCNSKGLNFVHTKKQGYSYDTIQKGSGIILISSSRLFINNVDGFIGIGTTTPAAKLDVKGGANITGTLTARVLSAQSADISSTLTANALNVQNATIANTLTANSLSANSLKATSANISGKVNIGTSSSNINLDVKGTIRSEEVRVCVNQGCDYVFEDDYELMNLNDLHSFIKTNKHLPDVAPAAEMEAEGINLSEMNALLLRKVEELTLYILQQNEKMTNMQEQINELKKQ